MKETTKFIKSECERIYENADRYLKKLYTQCFNTKVIQNNFECYVVKCCHEDIEWLLVVAELETVKKDITSLMKMIEYRVMTRYR